MTPKWLLKQLENRDGHRSAWDSSDADTLVPQHRQGGMGGGKSKHRLSNLVWLDSIQNGLIEAAPGLQAEAKRRGIKISLHAEPSLIPVDHACHGLVLLDDWGGFELLTAAEAREWRSLQRTLEV